LRIFPTLLLFGVLASYVPLEFRSEVNYEETRVMGPLSGESCMILTSSVFDWSTRVTDRWTDRQTDGWAIAYARYIIYVVARKNAIHMMTTHSNRHR